MSLLEQLSAASVFPKALRDFSHSQVAAAGGTAAGVPPPFTMTENIFTQGHRCDRKALWFTLLFRMGFINQAGLDVVTRSKCSEICLGLDTAHVIVLPDSDECLTQTKGRVYLQWYLG